MGLDLGNSIYVVYPVREFTSAGSLPGAVWFA